MSLQFGIKEVYNLNIADFTTNKPFIYVDYAEAATNENSGERTDLRGGQGYYKLLGFDHTKDSTLSLTLPLVDLKMLALLAGEDLAEGAADVYKREELTVQGDATNGYYVTASETVISGTAVVNHLEGERDYGDEVTVGSVSGSTINLSGTVVAGDVVTAFYQYASPTTAKKISIKANKFPKTVKIYGDGLWRDQVTETDKAVKLTVHKAKPQLNYTLTTSSADATTLEITFDMYALKDADGDMSYMDYVIL
jgi:hypothetical protein